MKKKKIASTKTLRTLVCVVFFITAIMLTALITATSTYYGLKRAYTNGVISFLDKKSVDVVNLLDQARNEDEPVTIEEALKDIRHFKKETLTPENNFLECSVEPFKQYGKNVSNDIWMTTVYNSQTVYLTQNLLNWDDAALKLFGKKCVNGVGATYPLKVVMEGRYVLWGAQYCGGVSYKAGDDQYLPYHMCLDSVAKMEAFLK